MIRENDRIYFTEQDKQNVIIQKYTVEELKRNEKDFRTKRNRRRVFYLIILFIAIILSILIESIQYPSYIAIGFICFLIVLGEYIDRINIKAVRRKFYIEVLINEKLEIESYIEQTLSPGSKLSYFYPIKGTVSGSNYSSVFYVEKEQYEANVGDIIRISVKGDRL